MNTTLHVTAALLAISLVAACTRSAPVPEVTCAFPHALPPEVRDARLIFLGEIHGTGETPLLAAGLACKLAQSGARVTLALEMPISEQRALNAYLASDGGDAARSTLLSSQFWRGTPDGRASTGTLAMIERVRELRRAGLQLLLLPFDGASSPDSRDATMAANVRAALEADPSRRIVALVGNLHAKKTRGNPMDANWESMAFNLADQHPLTLYVLPLAGEAWFCSGTEECGPHPMHELPEASALGTGIHMGYSPLDGYDGSVLLPGTTAAEPAAQMR